MILQYITNETVCMQTYSPISWLELVKIAHHGGNGTFHIRRVSPLLITPSSVLLLKEPLIIFQFKNIPKIVYSTWKNLPLFLPT